LRSHLSPVDRIASCRHRERETSSDTGSRALHRPGRIGRGGSEATRATRYQLSWTEDTSRAQRHHRRAHPVGRPRHLRPAAVHRPQPRHRRPRSADRPDLQGDDLPLRPAARHRCQPRATRD